MSSANGETKFVITDTKLYVPFVPLPTHNNAKLLPPEKSGFKRPNNWNKYQSKRLTERQNSYLDYLIHASFQGVNRLFVLPFEDNAVRKGHIRYFLPNIKIKDYNVMIDGLLFRSASKK